MLSPEQLRAAKEALTTVADLAELADQLQKLGALTHYQARKIKINRFSELAFGPYLIQDKLGEGGMGKVYKAIHLAQGRTVALKVVRPHLMSNRTVLKRYQREAAAVAKLDHPNIVVLYDVDDVNGRYFLAMEYIDGIDLSRMVKEFGKPPERGLPNYQEACEYIRQAALGLAHAHERGLVHRDIKPSNILVHGERALPGTNGQAKIKLLDMGLVRSLSDEEDASRTELTRDGTVVGTPDYMAPEQAKNSSTVDGRADIYSLGCTLFFLFAGRPLYPDGSPIEKLLKHQVDPPPDLARIRPDIPPGLVRVWLRMIEKDRDKRYQSATDVATALYPFTPQGQIDNETAELPAFSFDPEPPQETFSPVESAAPAVDAPQPQVVVTPAPPTQRTNPPTMAPSTRKLPPTPLQRPTKPAPVTRPAPSVPSAMTLPRSDSPLSSESLPSTTAPKSPRSTKLPESDDTPPALERRRERRKSKATRSQLFLPMVVGASLAAIMLLVVVGVVLFGNKGHAVSTVPTENPNSTPPTASQPAPVVLAKLGDLLPPRTHSVLVFYPKSYYSRGAYSEQSTNSKRMRYTKLLEQKMRLNPASCERIVIPLSGPSNQFAVIGEGQFNDPAWLTGIESIPRTIIKPDTIEGFKAFQNLTWSQGAGFGVLLTPTTYALSPDRNLLRDLAERSRNNRPPEGVSEELRNHLTQLGLDRSYHALFYASAQAPLPVITDEGPFLDNHGIRSMLLKAKIVGEELDFEFVLSGTTKARVKNFLSLYLHDAIIQKYANTKPLIDQIAQGQPSENDTGKLFELTLTGRITLAEFHESLEKILPEPNSN